MEIDDRYLLVRNQPLSYMAYVSSQQPVPVAIARAVDSVAAVGAAEHLQATVATLRYQEPIARTVRGWMGQLTHWWNSLPLSSGARTAIVVIAIIVAATNIGLIMPVVLVGMMLYVPYYMMWWLFFAPETKSGATLDGPMGNQQPHVGRAYAAHMPGYQPHQGQPLQAQPLQAQPQYAQALQAQPVAKPGRAGKAAKPKPMSLRQWRLAKRTQLSRMPSSKLWSEITGSWLVAGAVVAVFSFLAGLFLISYRQPIQPVVMGMTWTALVSLFAAFVAIGLGKIWQRSEGDWPLRRFAQLTSGFAVGGFAYLLANYLMVWPNMVENSGQNLIYLQGRPIAAFNINLPSTDRWAAFTDGKNILLPAYLAYFPLMMGLIGWWKQVDPLRRSRFSFWSILWSVIVASAINQLLVPFPQPWCALLAGCTSLAVQIACPWIDSDERLGMYPVDTPVRA